MEVRTMVAGGAALLVFVGVVMVYEREPAVATLPMEQSKAELRAPTPDVPAPASEAAPPRLKVQSNPEELAAAVQAQDESAVFRTDAAGRLILDEKTRLNIETLVAQHEPSELYAAVREHTENLPPDVAKSAEELTGRFVQYQQAQRQTYPPENAPLAEEDALRELDGLHALREAHFGPEVAKLLYGNEEALAREMIEVLRVENDASLTAQEKLERAQALRERLPGVARIERRNREAAMQNERQGD